MTRRATVQAIAALPGRAAAAACIALAAVLCATPCAATPFKEMVGLQVKYAQGESPKTLELLTDLGVRWVRDHVAWSTIEPVAGAYRDFPNEFKQRLAFYKRHGIGVVFVLGLTNRQAYPPTDEQPARHADPEAFARHAVAVARMLKEAGVEFTLEIWNEPHGKGFELYDLFGGQWNGTPPSPWLDHYLKIVRSTVTHVKQYDSAIRILTDDDMWVLHYWFLEGGLPRQVDGFAIHPYTIGVPEMTAAPADVEWARPFTVVDPDRAFGSAVRRLVQRGADKLGHKPQIWITEWGWAIGDKDEHGGVTTEDTVAAYLPRAFVLAAAAEVRALCWFSSQDTVDGPMGLLANNGQRRKAYRSFKTMVDELGPKEYSHQVLGRTNRTHGVQAHAFKGKGDHRIVVWNVDGSEARVRIDAGVQLQRVVDALGHAVPVESLPGNVREVPVDATPVYLTVKSLPTPASSSLRVTTRAHAAAWRR